MSDFRTVKNYLAELSLPIRREDAAEEWVIIDEPGQGLRNLVIDCESPILVLEQLILKLAKPDDIRVLQRLLQMNRQLVHGAFTLDDTGERVIFRDTLQLQNLDLNELEGSIQALSLALAEHSEELLAFSRG